MHFQRADNNHIEQPDTDDEAYGNVLVQRLSEDRVELLVYPNGASLGEFTIESE